LWVIVRCLVIWSALSPMIFRFWSGTKTHQMPGLVDWLIDRSGQSSRAFHHPQSVSEAFRYSAQRWLSWTGGVIFWLVTETSSEWQISKEWSDTPNWLILKMKVGRRDRPVIRIRHTTVSKNSGRRRGGGNHSPDLLWAFLQPPANPGICDRSKTDRARLPNSWTPLCCLLLEEIPSRDQVSQRRRSQVTMPHNVNESRLNRSGTPENPIFQYSGDAVTLMNDSGGRNYWNIWQISEQNWIIPS
jgi:hypothetical protein